MSYLIPSDYDVQTRKSVRDLLKTDDTKAFDKAERTAVDMMKSYLGDRYDIASIFLNLELYDSSKTYEEGDLVYFKEDEEPDSDYTVYTCIAPAQGNEPTDSNYFTLGDPRNHFMIMFCIDILLYHLYSSRSKRNIPELREDRYDDAIDWLIEASTGKVVTSLPSAPTTAIVTGVRFNSHTAEDHRY